MALPNAVKEIVPGVLTWGWFAERFGYDFNGYLVRGDGHGNGGNVAVDPVEMSEEVLAAVCAEGVSKIVLTNRNHFRDAEKLRKKTGAKVAIHPADAAFAREKGVLVEEELAIGGRVGPFQILDARGKSPGEVALLWPERRLLVIGDACVGKAPGVLGLLPDKVIDDRAALIESLRRIALEVDFDTLLLGDGHSILQNARAVLAGWVHSLS